LGVPVQEINLSIDRGGTLSFPVVWLSGGVGVDPAGSIPTVIVRQIPADTPALTFGSVASPGGSVVAYSPPVFNYTLFDTASESVIITTAYPIQVTFGALDSAALAFPVYRWSLFLLWPDTTNTPLVSGEIDVNAV
jgi:hypothetical protein